LSQGSGGERPQWYPYPDELWRAWRQGESGESSVSPLCRAARLGEIAQGAPTGATRFPKPLKFQAVQFWRAACSIASVKYWTCVFDWAVVTALSLLIVAALVHAGGQLRAEGMQTQVQTVQR